VTTAILVAAVGALVGAVVALWRKAELVEATKLAEKLRGERDVYRDRLNEALTVTHDEVQRREAVIARLKNEIHRLEYECRSTGDPGAIADRLRRLLADPEATRPRTTQTFPGVPRGTPSGGNPNRG